MFTSIAGRSVSVLSQISRDFMVLFVPETLKADAKEGS
jgi:hypothetical protein